MCTAFGTTIGVAFSGRAKDAAKATAASAGKSFFIIGILSGCESGLISINLR
jgi:hypothetical protein